MNKENTTTKLDRMNKELYIKPHTRTKLSNILSNLYGIELNCRMNSKKDFGTSEDDRLRHTDEGNFFVGNMDTKIKLGKILSACTELKDFEIERVVTTWKEQYMVTTENVEVSSDVAEVYQMSGVGNSCMAHKDSEWFKIYEDIGSKMVFIRDGSKLLARALLHDLTDIKQSVRIKGIDRIFFDNEIHKITLQKWAKENGYKDITSYHNPLVSSPIERDYNHLPYADTIYYVIDYADEYRLANTYDFEGVYEIDVIQETNGGSRDGEIGAIGEDMVYCEDTEEYLHQDDAYYCESDSCYYASTDYLVYIDGSGYYNQDDDNIAYDEHTSEYAFMDDLKYTVGGYYTSSDEYVQLTDGKHEGEYEHMDKIYELSNGDIVHEDDGVSFIEDTDEYVLTEDAEDNGYFKHSDNCWYSYAQAQDEEDEDEEEDTEEVA